jgi:chromosome segregation ATPase
MKTNHRLRDGRGADTTRRRQRVLAAINNARNVGDDLTVASIARNANVNRSFLYRHQDLLTQLHLAQEQPSTDDTGPAASRASLAADLANAQERNSRLHGRIRHLEGRLSELLGERAWRESGLGAPDDIEQLKLRVVHLEQQVVNLTATLRERDDELTAARVTNRQLMAQLNTRQT